MYRQNPQCPGIRNPKCASRPHTEAYPGCCHGGWISEPAVLYHGTRVISEAMALPDLPDWFRELGQIILTGDFRDGQQLGTVCESLWQGLNIWAKDHRFQIISPQRIPF